jgi:hypothetical protein
LWQPGGRAGPNGGNCGGSRLNCSHVSDGRHFFATFRLCCLHWPIIFCDEVRRRLADFVRRQVAVRCYSQIKDV